jgi:hypothetical protein
MQLTSIVRHTIKTPSVTPPSSQSPLTRGMDGRLRTQTVFSLSRRKRVRAEGVIQRLGFPHPSSLPGGEGA